MYTYEKFKSEVVKSIEKATGKKVEETALSVPPNPELGDLSTTIAFSLGKNPKAEAEKVAKKIKPSGLILEVKTVGPYINFYLDRKKFTLDVLKESLKKDYGEHDLFKGKKAIIEHTSVNPNASPHIGRGRNAIIGDTLTRVLRAVGYNLKVHYYVNDVGKQIAVLVFGCENKDLNKLKFSDMLDNYVKAHKEIGEKPELEKHVLSIQKKFEDGDKETVKKFKKIVGICLEGQRAILKRLNTDYDVFVHESDFLFDGSAEKVLSQIKKLPQVRYKGNSVYLDLSEFGIDKEYVLIREDGTHLYTIKDLAYHLKKLKEADINFGVYGTDHQLHFKQLFKVLELLLGKKAVENLHYIFYEFVLLPEGKMSTRKGEVVLLEDFIGEAYKRIYKEVEKRWPKLDKKDKEEIANMIAVGAVRFSIVKVAPQKTITFNWDKALSFEGDTGPYLQYAYVRCNSILRKLGKLGKANYAELIKPEEQLLVKKISEFPEVVKSIGKSYEVYALPQYLLDLTHAFSDFYEKCPVIKAETEGLKTARVELVKATKNVLKNGLNLLGIEAPERM